MAASSRPPPEPFALAVSPHGRIIEDPAPPEDSLLDARLAASLRRDLRGDGADGGDGGDGGDGLALIELGARHPSAALPASVSWFRDLARALLSAAAASATGAHPPPAPPPDLDFRALSSPPLLGREYLGGDVLRALWQRMGQALADSVAAGGTSGSRGASRASGATGASAATAASSPGSLGDWLSARHEAWAVVGRVCLHLAENRKDPDRPFAFLATYAAGMSAAAKVQHRPLGQALAESAGSGDDEALLRLLLPVHRAAQGSALLRELLDDDSIFRPLAWTAGQAHRFLRDVPAMEAAGLVVRVPDWWRPASPPRVTAQVTIGGTSAPGLGAEGLMKFRANLALDGDPLSDEEWARLREAGAGLVSLRGRWVEVDAPRLQSLLDAWSEAERAAREGIPFHQAMRLLAGAERPAGVPAEDGPERSWTRVVAGPWLAGMLERLRTPEASRTALPGSELRATLRPYQEEGVRWLGFLNELGLGGCLADDMGLGKTVQVLALLLVLKARGIPRHPHLVVAPASLLGNWRAEAARFAPSLTVRVAHASGDGLQPEIARGADLVVTTYGALATTAWLRERAWDTLVLDEAQAIKNPGARQAKAARQVGARVRLTLTGTPVENRAGDLWSLFDFLQPGLLGTAAEFRRFVAGASRTQDGWAPLRALVSPYVLRRMKTDPRVAPDLPAKTELACACGLSREQAVLYQRAVDELGEALEGLGGISRKGAVLATLMRLKQICNHPSHLLADGGWETARSGKLLRLAELIEPIAQRQEKALVFTQFREAVEPLAAALSGLFGREGLVLHGQTAIGKRQEIVRRFQSEDELPFLVLSLKAGGTGLNLTAATHVVHFDRWWNPAVEDQATDRAFRIGQTRGVMVHKMICRGTVEERVDEMIRAKRGLAKELLGGTGELSLTEMGDDELMSTLCLDLSRARVES